MSFVLETETVLRAKRKNMKHFSIVSINFMAFSFHFYCTLQKKGEMGKYIRRALSPLIEMSVITLQFAYRSYPSPPLSTCPSISPSFLFVENMFPFFCPLLHLLSSLVPLCPTVSFHLLPRSLSLTIIIHTRCLSLGSRFCFSSVSLHPFLTVSLCILYHKELSAGTDQ